jgi:F-box-like
MPGLRDLPAELLLHVYQLLDDIDDALHLARTCNRLYRVFNDPTNGRGILKSIIVRYRSRHFMALYMKVPLY